MGVDDVDFAEVEPKLFDEAVEMDRGVRLSRLRMIKGLYQLVRTRTRTRTTTPRLRSVSRHKLGRLYIPFG